MALAVGERGETLVLDQVNGRIARWDASGAPLPPWPLALRTPNRVFLSHSLPSAKHLPNFDLAVIERDTSEEKDLEYGGSVYSLVWGRDTSTANAIAFLQRVDADLLITGHIPCEKGFAVPNDRQLILDSLGSPACYCLFPTDQPLTHAELVERVAFL